MDTVLYQQTLPLRHHVDVFVAGGGPAGVAAAVAAARQGAKVFLAEAQGAFGGSGTTALVPAFMPFGNGHDFLAGGIGREIYDAIVAMGAIHDGLHSSVSIRGEHLKRIYDTLVEQAGVGFTFHTTLIDVAATGEMVDYVVLAAKSGVFAVKAKIYIDCTGDGDLCAWAGADWALGNEDGVCMPATLCSLWSGIDWSRVTGPDSRRLEDAFRDKIFAAEDRHLPGMWKLTESQGGGNIGHAFGVNATDEASLTKAMVDGRRLMDPYRRYYTEYLTGFEKMELAATGAYLGVRESRRVVCDYTLCGQDFVDRAAFPDEIGRFSYPVDIHIMAPDKASYDNFQKEYTSLRYKPGESYGIPYRCLIPKKLGNVLTAGRCVGTDRQMQASIRVMPGCYITGQAAGIAATLALPTGNPRTINTATLQQKLRTLGAFLPV